MGCRKVGECLLWTCNYFLPVTFVPQGDAVSLTDWRNFPSAKKTWILMSSFGMLLRCLQHLRCKYLTSRRQGIILWQKLNYGVQFLSFFYFVYIWSWKKKSCPFFILCYETVDTDMKVERKTGELRTRFINVELAFVSPALLSDMPLSRSAIFYWINWLLVDCWVVFCLLLEDNK